MVIVVVNMMNRDNFLEEKHSPAHPQTVAENSRRRMARREKGFIFSGWT